MKRFLALALLPGAVLAGNVSVSALVGYGLPIPGQYVGNNSESNAVVNTDSYEAVYGSPADGIRVGAEVGYSLNEFFALGLGVRYEMSSEFETTSDNLFTGGTSGSSRKTQITQIALVPDLLVTLPGEVYRPYVRVGWHVGFPTQIVKYSTTSTVSADANRSYEREFTGGLAQGFLGGLGIEYRITPSMGILAEIASESWTWGPTESEYTKYTEGGEDALSQMNESEKKYEYVDSYTEPAVQDTTKASKSLRGATAMTALSINVGLRFEF